MPRNFVGTEFPIDACLLYDLSVEIQALDPYEAFKVPEGAYILPGEDKVDADALRRRLDLPLSPCPEELKFQLLSFDAGDRVFIFKMLATKTQPPLRCVVLKVLGSIRPKWQEKARAKYDAGILAPALQATTAAPEPKKEEARPNFMRVKVADRRMGATPLDPNRTRAENIIATRAEKIIAAVLNAEDEPEEMT